MQTMPELNVGEIKRKLQDHLQEGLLLVVGSGLSVAEGLPGMPALAKHLLSTIPARLAMAPDPGWSFVAASLGSGQNLEDAMSRVTLHETTVDAIVEATASYVGNEERKVIERVMAGERQLPLSRFLQHLFKAGKRFDLITTNYDRLVEMATEVAHIGVDSRFVGYLHGELNAKRSADSHRESCVNGKNICFRPLPCLRVYKPHGSLDWYEVDGTVVRCPLDVGKVPVVITPGTSKYRESFRLAFDEQRTAGNRAASHAQRLMFVGYGFNDDHLEQHLCSNLRLTRPAVIMARTLTANAQKVIANSPGADVIALSAVSRTDSRTQVTCAGGAELILDEDLWSLEGFNKGVL